MSYHGGYEMQQEIFDLHDQITKLTIENAQLRVQLSMLKNQIK